MAYSFIGGKFRETDATGLIPLAGGLLYTYAAGTLTPQATYTDAGGLSANTNPVVLDSAGRADVFLGTSAYRMILKSAFGTTIWDEDNVLAPGASVFAFAASLLSSIGSSLVGFIQTGVGAVARTSQAKQREWISVLDFGADPTGVADSTAAFNLATQAAASFSAALQYNIIIPSGKYKINGTVYVRAGQTLWGQGHGSEIDCSGAPAATPSFVLGAGSGGTDGSGSPVKIGNFWTFGGSTTSGVIKTAQQGFEISSVFMTSPGIGIELNGAGDGLLSGLQIDQCLTGILITGSQNIQITNFDIYLPNFGITLGGASHDIAISNGVIEYAQFAGLSTSNGSTNLRNINVSNVNYTMNTQYGTFVGFLNIQSSNTELQHTGCSFRNMFGYAVQQAAGFSNQLVFTSCVFDGAPTTSGYTASTTAKGLTAIAGSGSTYEFHSCEFRNLSGEIALVPTGVSFLKIHGGSIFNCPQTRLNITATDVPKISIKGITGFPFIINTASAQAVVLPYWGASTVWKVAAKGNTLTSGNSAYAAAEESAVSVAYEFSGTGNTYVDKMLMWQTPSRTFPPQLAMAVCFGVAAGGAASQAGIVQTGTICVSVAVTTANASNFDWYAETAI